MPKFVILEYGVAEGAINPYDYDPWTVLNAERRPLTDKEYYDVKTPFALRSTRHMSQILGVVKKYAKFDFEIVALQYQFARQYLRENRKDVFVVSASVGAFFNDEFMAEFKDDFYMCISAGNDDIRGEGLGSEKPYWTSVGAVDTNLKPTDYSSWGKGEVDFVGISGEEIEFEYFGKQRKFIQGTSFACPQHATQIMNLMMAMKSQLGYKPPIKDVLAIRNKFTYDIIGNFEGVSVGHDLRTGLGYYEWKDRHGYMKEITMQVGGSVITVEDNGVEKLVQSPVPIQVIDGNTVLPLRVLAESLGLRVSYDATTKTIKLLGV